MQNSEQSVHLRPKYGRVDERSLGNNSVCGASLLSPRLTCPSPEPQAAQQVAGQPVSVPDGELHAGLSQINVSDAVVHHGVVEHGVDCPAQHARLLSTLPAGVWQHEAGAQRQGRKLNLGH